MIETSRRNFLIGGAAAVTALMLSPSIKAIDGIVVKGIIQPRYRRIYDVLIGCDPNPRDVAVNHVIRRNHDIIFAMRANARASFRWVAVPDGELIFRDSDVMRYEIDSCADGMEMCFHCQNKSGVKCAEYFEWKNDKLVRTDYQPLDPDISIEKSLTRFRKAS